MKTEELISLLSRDPGFVDPRAPARWLTGAALVGVAAALPLMLLHLGINPALGDDARTLMFWFKLAFVVAVAITSGRLVARLARPGVVTRRAQEVVALPVLALWALAALVLFTATPTERMALLLGSSWRTCPFNIVLLSLLPFALLLVAGRSLAPTRLRLAGSAIGLFAGALGTLVYLLHCPELEAPFLAVWYVLGMAIPAAAGAIIGPRALRW